MIIRLKKITKNEIVKKQPKNIPNKINSNKKNGDKFERKK